MFNESEHFFVHIKVKSRGNIQKILNFVYILYLCHYFFVILQIIILGESVSLCLWC